MRDAGRRSLESGYRALLNWSGLDEPATLPYAHHCTHRNTTTVLPFLPFLPRGHASSTRPGIHRSGSLSLSFLVTSCSHPWPVPRLGFTYLGHSSSTMSLCRYFRQRACLDWTNPRAARLPPTKMGAKAVSPRNPTTNTRGPAQ